MWCRYSELVPDWQGATVEDFLSARVFMEGIRQIEKQYPQLPRLSQENLEQGGKLKVIRKWLSPLGLEAQVVRPLIDEIKQSAVASTKASDIDTQYQVVLKTLASSSFWAKVKKACH